MSDKRERKSPQVPVFKKDYPGEDALCKLSVILPNNFNKLQESHKNTQSRHGADNASPRDMASQDKQVCPISNAPGVESLDEPAFPDKFQLAIRRANRRIAELECVVRDRDERVSTALAMLNDEMVFWRTFLHDHIGETMGGILRRVLRIETTISRLVEKGSRYSPPLDIPEQWKKDHEPREKRKV